jgi:hypothetical protein
MASLGKLSASVVHEINNPIAGILNLIMLMKRMVEEDSIGTKEIDQFNQYLTLMETETRRTSRIVSNLLAFSRQSKIELKRISLNRLIEQMAFSRQSKIELKRISLNRMIEQILFLNSNLLKIAGVKVSTDLDPNLPDLVGSEDQLQQVFMFQMPLRPWKPRAGVYSILKPNMDYATISWRSILKTAGSAYRRKIYQSFLNPFLPPKKNYPGTRRFHLRKIHRRERHYVSPQVSFKTGFR